MKGDRPRECVSGRWPDAPALPDHPEVRFTRDLVLRLERRLEGSDIQRLSTKAGVSRQTLEMVLAGEVWPDARLIGRLRAYFGDSFIQIGGDSSPIPEPEPTEPLDDVRFDDIVAALGGSARVREQIAELERTAERLGSALRVIEGQRVRV